METRNNEKVLLVMVGLPARGKSYIAHKILTYFQWLGCNTEIFNVGKFRRNTVTEDQSSEFFSAENSSAKQQRDQLALTVLQKALEYLRVGNGKIGLFDATNTTDERRLQILEYCALNGNLDNLNVIFIESICNDESVIVKNVKQKIKHSPDYAHMDQEIAMEDLMKRIDNYKKVYQSIENDDLQYIKLINLRSKVVCNRIYGLIPHQLISYLMSIHIGQRPILLTRPGHVERAETEKNVDILKQEMPTLHDGFSNELVNSLSMSIATTSNCTLNAKGKLFANKLKQYMDEQFGKPINVYTSTLPRATDTAEYLNMPYTALSYLNMLNTGICHGLSLDEIQRLMPEELLNFKKDQFNYRIPGGESFRDMVERLSPFINEVERQNEPVLIISHLTTLQALYGYMMGKPIHEYIRESIPTNTIIRLTPTQYGYREERIELL